MYCSQHNQKPAAGACVVCGKLFCDDCLVRIDDKFYCKAHAADLIGIGGAGDFRDKYHYQAQAQDCFRSRYHERDCGYYPVFGRKSRLIAFLLCFFFGVAGFHRFYVGKVGSGILYLCTGGLFGIGWLIDLFVILCGGFRDANGMFLD